MAQINFAKEDINLTFEVLWLKSIKMQASFYYCKPGWAIYQQNQRFMDRIYKMAFGPYWKGMAVCELNLHSTQDNHLPKK